ncbi:hypothetical protein Hanom_Chr05g00431861 [Helianthus anomalus]
MKQNFFDDMKLWCYDTDSHEAVILFEGDKENFRMLDTMWIANMSATDINKQRRNYRGSGVGMSTVPTGTGTESTSTENPQKWVPVPNIPGTVPVFEGNNR